MEQAQKTTAKTKIQRLTAFRFKGQRRVVQLQFLQRLF